MSSIAVPFNGTHTRGLGLCTTFALVASLLTIGGCYEGMSDGEELGNGDLEVTPLEATCGPTMHVFPVADAHNIGYDPASCGTGTCEISCSGANANSDYHGGIDVFAYRGAPLVAVTSGTVIYAKEVSATSGLSVKFRDDCGWDYYYGHLDTIAVSQGQRVEAGQLIGTMGNTGKHKDGTPYSVHLHFNVSQNGDYNDDINPFELLKATSPTACGGIVPPPPPPAEPEPQPEGCTTSTLWADQALYTNQSVSSCNGLYSLWMQEDGNVVLYENATGTPLWHSQTHGTAGSALAMQSDGNFVLYDAALNPLWHTSTHGHPGAAMRVEEDGNVIVWEGWTAIWKAR